ncbi:MAG: YraN family protein [Planctomycetes bacterium]|nr:YraN family protein [Planctomycetota bacterium]
MLDWLRRRRRGAALGRRGERIAARYLRRRGMRILARNVRMSPGEIDLVALDGGSLVFVEVKSRGPGSWSTDLEKIDAGKRRALSRACRKYLSAIGYGIGAWRVDVVCVEFREGLLGLRVADVRWYPSAFDPIRRGV